MNQKYIVALENTANKNPLELFQEGNRFFTKEEAAEYIEFAEKVYPDNKGAYTMYRIQGETNSEKDAVFEQLAKEIVCFIQNEENTQKCIEFVRYELYLRCVSKRKLKEIAQEVEE